MEDVLSRLRQAVREAVFVDEARHLDTLLETIALEPAARRGIEVSAAQIAARLRTQGKHSLLERFLTEYGCWRQF